MGVLGVRLPLPKYPQAAADHVTILRLFHRYLASFMYSKVLILAFV